MCNIINERSQLASTQQVLMTKCHNILSQIYTGAFYVLCELHSISFLRSQSSRLGHILRCWESCNHMQVHLVDTWLAVVVVPDDTSAVQAAASQHS